MVHLTALFVLFQVPLLTPSLVSLQVKPFEAWKVAETVRVKLDTEAVHGTFYSYVLDLASVAEEVVACHTSPSHSGVQEPQNN